MLGMFAFWTCFAVKIFCIERCLNHCKYQLNESEIINTVNKKKETLRPRLVTFLKVKMPK